MIKYFWWHQHPRNTYLKKDLYIHLSCIMITYSISSNFCKKNYLQCYRLYNFPYFTSSHWMCSVRKGVLRNFAKFTGKHRGQSLFLIKLQIEATASALSRVFSYSRVFSCLFQQKNEMKKGKYPDGVEIWQIVIWSENVFKGNLMLQFSWLKQFC